MESSAKYIKEVILKRQSPFAFQQKDINNEELEMLFDSARWAASAFNEQPWRFIVGKKHANDNTFQNLVDILMPSNQTWAKDAPVLILVVSKVTFSINGKSNPHSFYDTGLAMGNFTVQATSMGLALHQMGGFDREKAKMVFDLNEDYEPVAVIALGYSGNAENLPDNLKQRALKPRERKPVKELVLDK